MPVSDWAPTVADVGALLHARTRDANGQEKGTFDDTTRPTEAQVNSIIARAAGMVANEIGEDIDARWWPSAAEVTTLVAALRIELGFFPEQVGTGRSPYAQLKALLDGEGGAPGALAALVQAMAESEAGGEVGAGDDLLPVFSFPRDEGGMIGWGTRW